MLCEELCGIAHFAMRGAVVVDEEAVYKTWLASTSTFAETQAVAAGNADIGRAQYAVCAACHGQQGEGIEALNGPKLAGQSEWYLRNQIHAFKNGLRGSNADDVYGRQMAPMAMTLANDAVTEQRHCLHPDACRTRRRRQRSVAMPLQGAKTYVVCAYCHGARRRRASTA